MWIKKTEEERISEEAKAEDEIRKTRLQKGFKFGVWTFVIYSTLAPFIYVLIGVPNGRFNYTPKDQVKWAELPDYFTEILSSAAFFALLMFIASMWDRKLPSSTLICDKCNKTKNYSKDKHCDCGGEYDFIYHYKWIEERKEESSGQ